MARGHVPPERILYEIFEHAEVDPSERVAQGFEPWPVQSESGAALALISGASVSLFREKENFETAHGPFEESRLLLRDHNAPPPRATHAAWTPENSQPELLAVAFSPGFVHVISSEEKQIAEFARPEWVKAGELAGIAMRGAEDWVTKGASAQTRGPELLVLGKEAVVWRFPVDLAPSTRAPLSSIKAEHYRPPINMCKQHPKGALCLAYCPSKSTLTVLGPGHFLDASGHSVPFSVSIWHLTSSAPFHHLVFSAGAVPPSLFETLRRPAWTQVKALPKAVCSPSGRHVAVLDSSKSLRVLALGTDGRGPVSTYVVGGGSNVRENASSDERREEEMRGEESTAESIGSSTVRSESKAGEVTGIHDVAWWADEALLVTRADGAVTVEKLPGLVNMLGESPEKFGPSPYVTRMVRKRAFVVDGVEQDDGNAEEGEDGGRPSESAQVGVFRRVSGWFSRAAPPSPPISKWRLTSIVERSPLEMMGVHIKHEEYGTALSLAKVYGLDTDLVYKARWEKSDLDSASVRDNLGKIEDRKWVITECIDRVMKSAEAMRALLQYGLKETEKWKYLDREDGWETLEVSAGSEAGGSGASRAEEAWWFRERRLQLLRCSDLLATFLVIHNNRYSGEKFAAFKAGSLKDLAVQLAQAGSAGSLEVLLKRHTHSLAQDWLAVLDSMPETVVPYSIRGLLPGPRPPVASVSRRPDWIEGEETVAAIGNGSLPPSAAESTEELVRLSRGLVWPTGDQLTEWYRARAVGIDSKSGLLEHSLYLLTLGADLGVRGLEQLSVDVQDLYEVVYGGKQIDEEGVVELTLVDWLKMGGFERYYTVMKGASKEDVAERLEGPADRVAQRWAARPEGTAREDAGAQTGASEGVADTVNSPRTKGGSKTETNQRSPPQAFPRRWLLLQAEKGDLGLVSTVLEAQLHGGVNKRLLTHEEVLDTALECVYTCPATDAWDGMAHLLAALNVTSKPLTPGGSPKAQEGGSENRRGDAAQQGTQSGIAEAPSRGAASIGSLALGGAGSKRARVAGFLQNAAERAAGQRGVASFFSRLPRKIGAGKEEEAGAGAMADILANLPRRGPDVTDADASEFENAFESFESPMGRLDTRAGFQEGEGVPKEVPQGLGREEVDDVAEGADVAARQRLEGLKKRVLKAERHVTAGRILARHQMARPLSFFLTCDSDPAGVKQLLRRLLAWSSRSNPPDAQWDSLWGDLSTLQSDAFPFLDTQYLLSEFVRALLRAGRLPLARAYVSGSRKRPPLLAEKAETLVLGAAREYFYSAASLDSVEIQRARECLDLLPTSTAANTDRELMEVLTVHLPKLGVELLPLQFKQLKEKEEVIQMALKAHAETYLKLPELLHIATLLGLSTSSEQSRVKALSADAAFKSGDVRFALSICLELVDEDYQPASGLAASLGQRTDGTLSGFSGPQVGPADRKKLLGFAIANVEEQGMGGLLRVWDGVDLALRCEECLEGEGLQEGLGEGLQEGSGEGFVRALLGAPSAESDRKLEDTEAVDLLKRVTRLSEPGVISPVALAFARTYLPALLNKCFSGEGSGGVNKGRSLDAGLAIRQALGHLALPASDELLLQLTKLAWSLGAPQNPEGERGSLKGVSDSLARTQFSSGELALSCLLEMGTEEGAALVEKVVQEAQNFAEVERATRLAIHYYGIQAILLAAEEGPRRLEKLLCLSTDELLGELRRGSDRAFSKGGGNKQQEDREAGFKQKGLQYGARLAALMDAKGLEGILPGVNVNRFASGDQEHQQELVLSLVTAPGGQENRENEPPKTRTVQDQSAALQKALSLAERYGVDRWRVLIRHAQTLLLSDWPDEEVAGKVREAVTDLGGREEELVNVLNAHVWPKVGGRRHGRLGLLLLIMGSLWPKLPTAVQSGIAKTWSPSDVTPSVPAIFTALGSAARTLATSAPDADLKLLIAPFLDGSNVKLLEVIRGHVTLQNAAALVEMVRELEAAFGVHGGASASSFRFVAVQKRFADGPDDVSKSGEGRNRKVGDRSRVEFLESAYDDSKPLIRELGPADLESFFSDVLERAYEAGGTSSPGNALRFRTRLYEDASKLFRAAFESGVASDRKDHFLGLASGFWEASGVLKDLELLRERGVVSDMQAAAAERSICPWPKVDADGKSGSVTTEQGAGESLPGWGRGVLKALILGGAPYRAVETVWAGVEERRVDERSVKESTETVTGEEAAEGKQAGLETGSATGLGAGLVAVYSEVLQDVLDEKQGPRASSGPQRDSKVGQGSLDLILAGLAKEDGKAIDHVRREVWTRMKAFTDSPDAPLKSKIRVLELLDALEDRGPQGLGVWVGWRDPPSEVPKEDPEGLGSVDERPKAPQTSLLLLRTAEVVERVWPGVPVDDVSTVGACERLFERLLDSGSSGAGEVSGSKAGALAGLLRLWEANSAAFGQDWGKEPEEMEGGDSEETGGGHREGRGSQGSVEESRGEAVSQKASKLDSLGRDTEAEKGAPTEPKGEEAALGERSTGSSELGGAEVGKQEDTTAESKGEKDSGTEGVGKVGAKAASGREISKFHRSYKLLLSLLLTSSTPRAVLVLLDSLSGSDVITQGEALELVKEAGDKIGNTAAAKLVLMLPLDGKDEKAAELLLADGVGDLEKGDEQRDPPLGPQAGGAKEADVAAKGADLERVAAARKEFDKVDADLLGLVLANGLLRRFAQQGGVKLLRALCLALTPLARDQQLLLLSDSATGGPKPSQNPTNSPMTPLAAVAFSCFVAELTAVQAYGFAGALVLQYLRVPPALATWDAAPEALLRYLRYLKRKLPQQVRIARGLNRALPLEEDGGLPCDAFLRSPVEEMSKRVVKLSSTALNTLVQDLK